MVEITSNFLCAKFHWKVSNRSGFIWWAPFKRPRDLFAPMVKRPPGKAQIKSTGWLPASIFLILFLFCLFVFTVTHPGNRWGAISFFWCPDSSWPHSCRTKPVYSTRPPYIYIDTTKPTTMTTRPTSSSRSSSLTSKTYGWRWTHWNRKWNSSNPGKRWTTTGRICGNPLKWTHRLKEICATRTSWSTTWRWTVLRNTILSSWYLRTRNISSGVKPFERRGETPLCGKPANCGKSFSF